ncbi:P-loop containing nucleoside triphosphate hydrolase protein [Scheffersomyces coipomensis]|uniref:P-loop containing nucleoside triphosphate hydrolase protein n=1 Tax=Scheffersomyces coipomensis TaxID=1788519 RepID=UPI00315DEF0F
MSLINKGLTNPLINTYWSRPLLLQSSSVPVQWIRFKHNPRKPPPTVRKVKKRKGWLTEEDPNAHNPSYKVGTFSNLLYPSKKTFETSSTGLDSIKSFNDLRIFPTVREAMIQEIKSQYNLKGPRHSSKEELEIKPTPCQIAVVRKVNQPRITSNFLKRVGEPMTTEEEIDFEYKKQNELNKLKMFALASETGSGKTWAYLASILSKLKEDDMELFDQDPERLEDAKCRKVIRSVILVSTHELVEQISQVIERANKIDFDLKNVPKSFQNYIDGTKDKDGKSKLNIRLFKWQHGDPHTKLFHALRTGRIDIMVTTPGKIAGLQNLDRESDPFRVVRNVKYCVVDEADTLFDRNWIDETLRVVRTFGSVTDLIFCSATITKEFKNNLNKTFPQANSIIEIVTPSLHKISRNVKISVIDARLAPYNGSVMRCCAQALYSIIKDGTEEGYVKRAVIFVNQKVLVNGVIHALTKKYHFPADDIVGLNGSDSIEDRLEILDPFLKPAEKLDKEDPKASKMKVLVTTDLLGRGVDFNGLKNVIIIDLPNSSVDLVHRIGRTGRMGQSGRVLIIVDKKGPKNKLVGIPRAVLKGMPIG